MSKQRNPHQLIFKIGQNDAVHEDLLGWRMFVKMLYLMELVEEIR